MQHMFDIQIDRICNLIDEQLQQELREFVQTHQKSYTPQEFSRRQAIFAINKMKRTAHNLRHQKGEVGWEEAVNQFEDMTWTAVSYKTRCE